MDIWDLYGLLGLLWTSGTFMDVLRTSGKLYERFMDALRTLYGLMDTLLTSGTFYGRAWDVYGGLLGRIVYFWDVLRTSEVLRTSALGRSTDVMEALRTFYGCYMDAILTRGH
jgi:hypothetical protein